MNPDDEPRHDPSALPEGESGLFSQLPKTRPGTRSPRRRGAATERQAPRTKQQAASSKQPGAAKPAAIRASEAAAAAREAPGADPLEPVLEEPATETADRGTRPPKGTQEEHSLGPGSLEDLAWAGVAVTAEAATLGIRLLGRAVDAARRATDRN